MPKQYLYKFVDTSPEPSKKSEKVVCSIAENEAAAKAKAKLSDNYVLYEVEALWSGWDTNA